jgi:hypothetical protein
MCSSSARFRISPIRIDEAGVMRWRCIAPLWVLLAVATGCGERPPTDYQTELRAWEQQIAAARAALARSPEQVRLNAQLVYASYNRAALTGDPRDFTALRTQLRTLEPVLGHLPEMQLLQVKLECQLHRFPQARARWASLRPAPQDPEWQALDADLALQEGRHEYAQAIYQKLLQGPREARWDHLARYAHLQALAGEPRQAEQLYRQAQALLTAKEIRHYAWLEVQLGALALRHGRNETALQHYRRADRVYSGYWFVADHLAEWTAANGELPAAIEQYRRLAEQWPRPDLQRSLGDVYSLAGDGTRARAAYALAEAEYAGSAARGEVHYLHHLADFHADVTGNAAAAIQWARQDLALRQHYSAYDTLAWALYRNGQFAAALEQSAAALAGGAHDVHVLRHAALIHAAAGRGDAGTQLLQRAMQVNPAGAAFHVHR